MEKIFEKSMPIMPKMPNRGKSFSFTSTPPLFIFFPSAISRSSFPLSPSLHLSPSLSLFLSLSLQFSPAISNTLSFSLPLSLNNNTYSTPAL